MKFADKVLKLQEENKNKVIFVKSGVFYIAIGQDAIFLHKKMQFKCTCFSTGKCKIGFPRNYIKKYTEELQKLDIPFQIYEFDDKGEPKLICEGSGININRETACNLGCEACIEGNIDNKTGNDYVQLAADLHGKTMDRCSKLPQRWSYLITQPLVDTSRKIRVLTVKANSVFIAPKTQSKEVYINALNERDGYLNEALKECAVYHAFLDDLENFIGARADALNHIKKVVEKIISEMQTRNPKLKDLNITIKADKNDIEYIDVNGNRMHSLKISKANITYLSTLITKTEEKIQQRIKNDRSLIKRATV